MHAQKREYEIPLLLEAAAHFFYRREDTFFQAVRDLLALVTIATEPGSSAHMRTARMGPPSRRLLTPQSLGTLLDASRALYGAKLEPEAELLGYYAWALESVFAAFQSDAVRCLPEYFEAVLCCDHADAENSTDEPREPWQG